MTQTLTITRPDDWHLHVRDGDAMHCVVPHTARQMGRAIIMPNLKPPVTTAELAIAYRDRILSAVPAGSHCGAKVATVEKAHAAVAPSTTREFMSGAQRSRAGTPLR